MNESPRRDAAETKIGSVKYPSNIDWELPPDEGGQENCSQGFTRVKNRYSKRGSLAPVAVSDMK